jgi:hypothetical protein
MIGPIGPTKQMSDEQQTMRPGGKKKSPVVVKISIDEQTSLKLLTVKPNTIPTSTFCAMLVELGLPEWEKRETLYQQAQQS